MWLGRRVLFPLSPHRVALRSAHTCGTLTYREQSLLTVHIDGESREQSSLLMNILLCMLIGLRPSVSVMKAKWQRWSLSELLHVAWRTPHWKLTSSSYYCYESFIPHCRVKTPVPPLPISVETHLLTLYLSFLLGNIGAIIIPTSRVDVRAVSQALELCYLNISGLCTCVVPRSPLPPSNCFPSI